MKIAYTSDIHVDSSKENERIPQAMVSILKKNRPDVLVIAGDISHSLSTLENVLSVFKNISCRKLFIPGNHDIWIQDEYPDSYMKYSNFLPRIAKRNDFIPLWREPYITGDYGFCGSMGWYDYSFKPMNLNLSEKIYKEKIYEGHTWMDKTLARFHLNGNQIPDEEITSLLYNDFIKQYEEISKKTKKIIAIFHHMPFKSMIGYRQFPVWNFFATYMGSDCFGDLLLKKENIELAIYGHSHIKQHKKITRPVGDSPLTIISSPFGYFKSEGLHPESRWHSERLSYIEI